MFLLSIPSIVGFIVGILTILAVEGIVILYVIRHFIQNSNSKSSDSSPPPQHPLDPRHSISSVYQKQGVLWFLDSEKLPKISAAAAAEQTRKREIVEVSPIRKAAKIKDRTLILTEADGSITKIVLKGCEVVAVSATSLATKKWAKRFPIKVESKTTTLYHGSKILYIYAETSWEKESWCKALRVASSDNKERLLWFSKLNEDFRSYLKSLTEGYPYLIKPDMACHGSLLDKTNRLDEPPSKVRQLWKKLSKKASPPNPDEKKIADKYCGLQDTVSASSRRLSNEPIEESSDSSCTSTRSGRSSHVSDISDAGGAEKYVIDEGTLCCNLMMSRLFFDANNNADIKNSVKARIQRTLANMRTPSYVGEVTCTDIDLGSLPPFIRSMRAVPTDMNELWAMEMDIEYSGGVVLYIEARLEVGELDDHNAKVETNNEAGSLGEVTTVLLEDFKHFQEDLKFADDAGDSPEHKDVVDTKFNKLSNSRASMSNAGSGSRWKSLLNSVAKHVSQVPLTLAIRVEALKGTVQLYIKPPPSDELWFGFTSMPEINFQVESSVKDHKITYGRVASFLINRFKASIHDTLVLPNCESACLSWMLGEKDDWVPMTAAPFIWLNRETASDLPTSTEGSGSHSNGPKTGDGDHDIESKQAKQQKMDVVKQLKNEEGVASSTISRSSSDSNVLAVTLRTPLLQNGEAQDAIMQDKEESTGSQSPSRYISLREQRSMGEDDDGKPKRAGRRARMFDLGKKMVEKIEEKRRHIEEKSRFTVDKLRGP